MTRRMILSITLVVIAIATIVLAVQAHHKIAHEMTRQKHIDAFDSYMKTVPLFIHDHKPYRSDRFPLPPFAMLFVAPFTLLSRPDAQAAWVICKPFFFVPIFLLALSIIRRGGGNVLPGALLLIGAGWFFPVIGDIQEGQMNLLMLLPLAAGLWMAQEESLGGDVAAGLLVAMAICIKVTPLAFLAYFLYRRRWIIGAAIVGGIGIWIFLVPAIFFGWSQNITWLGQWGHIMIAPYILHDKIKFGNGESIPEFILRLFAHVPAWKTMHNGVVHNHYLTLIRLPQKTAHLIGRIVVLIIAIGGIWWARKKLPSLRTRRYAMEIACVGMFMLWASERTWVPHYVTLIFALMAVGMIAEDTFAVRSSRKFAWIALSLTAFLMLWTSEFARVLGPNGRHYIDTVDVVLWSSLTLAAVILTARFTDNAQYIVNPKDSGGLKIDPESAKKRVAGTQ